MWVISRDRANRESVRLVRLCPGDSGRTGQRKFQVLKRYIGLSGLSGCFTTPIRDARAREKPFT